MALHKRGVRVGAVRAAARGIKHLTLLAADGQALPPVEAGSHIDLWLPGGLVRQYSVIEAGADGRSYSIAVQREPIRAAARPLSWTNCRWHTTGDIRPTLQLSAGCPG